MLPRATDVPVLSRRAAGELSGVTSAVVYVNTRAGADMLAAQLKRASINSAAYHAGLRHDQRQTVQVGQNLCMAGAHSCLTPLHVSCLRADSNCQLFLPAPTRRLWCTAAA